MVVIIVNACARRLGSRAGPENAVCGDDAWRRPLGARFSGKGWLGGRTRGREEGGEGISCILRPSSYANGGPPQHRFAAAPSDHRDGSHRAGGGCVTKFCKRLVRGRRPGLLVPTAASSFGLVLAMIRLGEGRGGAGGGGGVTTFWGGRVGRQEAKANYCKFVWLGPPVLSYS